MKITVEFDSEDPKAKELAWFLGNCLEEWQKPELEIANVETKRKCLRCLLWYSTTQLRGRFVCPKCKGSDIDEKRTERSDQKTEAFG